MSLNTQSSTRRGSLPADASEHEFTVRPDAFSEAGLAERSFVDHEAKALIAEFKKLQAANVVDARQQVQLLLDHVDSPTIRSFLVDCLKISTKEHFEYSQVRADIFNALFKRKNVNWDMREEALLLIAQKNPELEGGQILVSALKERNRSFSSVEDLVNGLVQVRDPKTLANVADLLKSGRQDIRLTLIKAFSQTTDASIRQAIIESKNDKIMEIGDEATRVADKWNV